MRAFVHALLLAASLLTGLVAPAHAATLTLSTNQNVFSPGNRLALSAGIVPTSDAGVPSDIYVAVVLPSGAVLTLDRHFAWNAALVPILTAVPLANVQAPNFYAVPLPATLPGGLYTSYVVAARTGISPLDGGAWLGSASTPIIVQTNTQSPASAAVACSSPLYCGPIIDTHAHPIAPAQGSQNNYVDGLVDLMDRTGVAITALHRNAYWATGPAEFGAAHDLWVTSASQRHPGRILTYLAGFDPSSPDAISYIQDQFRVSSQWKAIGELDLRNPGAGTQIPINSPNMMAVLRLAAQLHVPVIIHYNFDYGVDRATGVRELEEALSANPDTVVVLAHNPAPDLMARHPNLWAEFTPWAPQADQILTAIAQLDPSLFDRIVLCATDLQAPDLMVSAGLPTPVTYADAIALVRRVLGTLSLEQAEKIAYKNVGRLLEPFPTQHSPPAPGSLVDTSLEEMMLLQGGGHG